MKYQQRRIDVSNWFILFKYKYVQNSSIVVVATR
jgi:hypothetical protein